MRDRGRHLKTRKVFRQFGLTGEEVSIQFNDYINEVFTGFRIPARVVSENERFITVEILPHFNLKYDHVGISKPYTVCINKINVYLGEVEIYVNGARFIQ